MAVSLNEHIRAKCFHPNGAFVEFEKDEVETSIPERFENIVRRHPDRLAVRTKEHARTYDELNKEANRVARAILEQRDEEAQPVGLLLDHDAPVIAALLGALKAGKFYVPLDPSSPQGRLGYMLKDSDARLLVTNGRNLSLARQLAQNSFQIINIDELDSSLSSGNLGLSISSEENCLHSLHVRFDRTTQGSPPESSKCVAFHYDLHERPAYLHRRSTGTSTLH